MTRSGSSRGPDGLVAVGLDVGTGFVKVAALGRLAMFPSLYSCTYAPGAGDADVLARADAAGGGGGGSGGRGGKGGSGGKGRQKAVLRDAVGEAARVMASGRYATLTRPVKHGVPHDGQGYARLAEEALRAVGIDDPQNAVICAGVPYDTRKDKARIKKLIEAAVSPAYCRVLPQAYGTVRACGRGGGTVVNIGHGTTEIMRAGPEGMYGVSIQKASEFVLQQLAQMQGRSGRDAYTDHEAVLGDDPKMTARLVELLATHIADEIHQFGPPPPPPSSSSSSLSTVGDEGAGDAPKSGYGIILCGGGSLIPGMAEALEKAIAASGAPGSRVPVCTTSEPSYSNAIGLEMSARDMFPRAQKALAERAALATGGGTYAGDKPAGRPATSADSTPGAAPARPNA